MCRHRVPPNRAGFSPTPGRLLMCAVAPEGSWGAVSESGRFRDGSETETRRPPPDGVDVDYPLLTPGPRAHVGEPRRHPSWNPCRQRRGPAEAVPVHPARCTAPCDLPHVLLRPLPHRVTKRPFPVGHATEVRLGGPAEVDLLPFGFAHQPQSLFAGGRAINGLSR